MEYVSSLNGFIQTFWGTNSINNDLSFLKTKLQTCKKKKYMYYIEAVSRIYSVKKVFLKGVPSGLQLY